MPLGESTAFRWSRPDGPLPSRNDFDPTGWGLDAQSAWKSFGGRSLEEAFAVFTSNPIYHQEHFMWMGPVAYEYYFPVVDRYLRNAPSPHPLEGWEAVTILGSDLCFQLEHAGSSLSAGLLHEILDLATFVLSEPARFDPDPEEQRRLVREWRRVSAAVASRCAGP